MNETADPRIEIAGDDPAAVHLLAERVRGLGYTLAARSAGAGTASSLLLVHVAEGGGREAVAAAERAREGRRLPVLFTGPGAGEAREVDGGEAGADAYVVAPVSDRELRLHIELAISRGRERRAGPELEAFFAASRELFCFLDFSGTFRLLNPAWERTLGFTREELMSRPFIEFVHPDDRERTLAQNGAVRAGDRAINFENRYICKDGSYRWFLWSSAPDRSSGLIYGVARDITARREAEEENMRLVAELEASLAEVRTLREILPICSYCRKIRDDEDFWHTVEAYISANTSTRFSHGICPECLERELGPELRE